MTPTIVDRIHANRAEERRVLVASLMADPASIAPKYFYDELGCALYGAICRLPEYYPTRTEAELFQARRREIAAAAGTGRQFVDLGAGDCGKARQWMPFLLPSRYVAVDFAAHEIAGALERLAPDFPNLEMVGVATDFSRTLDLDGVLADSPALFFYPGSSIGNFTPGEAREFLARIQRCCAARPGSSLLIGVDGKKAKAILDAAYDDALGVTAAFNLNLLRHLNRLLGTDFDVRAWRHLARFDVPASRIEMHLEARGALAVRWPDGERRFEAGERIHTENSYKWTAPAFAALLHDAGFGATRHWTDARGWFAVFLALA